MSKFNMNTLGLGNGMLNQFSQELKEGFTIEYIPINKIDENENNNYSTEDIDELVDSIRTVGLKQNLDVMQLPNGRYRLLTGHRRFKALSELAQEDSKYKMVPCTITALEQVQLPVSEKSKEKYLIHITNATQRHMTDSDKYNQYTDLVAIYTEAKNNGFTLTDKMRNLIAQDMQLSPAQIGKFDYIRNNADDELIDKIQNNKVSINEANDIAHLTKDEQKKAAKKPKIIDTLTEDSYKLTDFNDVTKRFAQFSCNYNEVLKKSAIASKEEYAKLLKHKENLLKELTAIEKIVNNLE